MASINGIQVKSLKSFRGHEGDPLFQGNVYFNKKKLGFWSQDFRGGSDNFDFEESVLDNAVSDYKASFPDTFRYKNFVSLESLLQDYCLLYDIEKQFKKYQKKGYHAMILLVDRIRLCYLPVSLDGSDEEILLRNEEFIAQNTKQMMGEYSVMVFHSVNDFNKMFDSQHPVYPIFCK